MRTTAIILMALLLLASCSNNENREATAQNNWISLRADSINAVKLTDTLVIYESVCRGCAYEGTTRFSISDSLEIIKQADLISTDNNSPDAAGGSVSKDIVLIPVRTGFTTIKVFKILSPNTAKEDSARFVTYTIHVTD